MKNIKRQLYIQLKKKTERGKVVVLYGPRRVGKTYLLQKLIKDPDFKSEKISFLKGDSRLTQDRLSVQNLGQIIDFINKKTTLLIVDEAQKVPNIGLNLKILVDGCPNLKIIASGSSSFGLANKVGEPLTGRKKTILLYPVSAREIIDTKSRFYYEEMLERHIIFGGYPEVLLKNAKNERKEYLDELIDSYLFKDILEFEKIKGAKKLIDLLALLAFQLGKEVSLTELGSSLGLHKDTVARYLDLLEKSFVIFNVRGFSRNLRKEIYKNSRWYFWDNGIRNAIINNFNPLNLRNDVGALWENYLIVERLKKQSFTGILSNNYFWRTYDKKEIDWIEERDGKLYGFEIKWKDKKSRIPQDWLKTYTNASYKLINKKNFLNFIL